MKSSFKTATMATVCGVLCGATVTLATSFTWDSSTASTSWVSATNWDLDDSYPQNSDDKAAIDGGGNLCTFDPTSDLTISQVTLSGSSPTWRKLHIKDKELTAGVLYLNDYGELDVDQLLTITDVFLSGSTKIDVADTMTMDIDGLFVDGPNTVLDLTTSGTFKANSVDVNASTDGADRSFKLEGGTLTLSYPIGGIAVTGDSNGHKAKWWFSTGSVEWEPEVQGPAVRLQGGDDFATDRAELDLDQDLTLPDHDGGLIEINGAVKIDIAANKTLAGPRIVIGSGLVPTVVKLVAASGAKIDIH